MGLLTEKVKLKLSPPYINHFGKLGYELPLIDYGHGEYHVDKSKSIEVDVHDLPDGSRVDVLVQCDNPTCNNIHYVRYYNYLKMMEKYNAVYCRECVIKLFHSGENAYNWNSLKTDEEREYRRNDRQYRTFRREVLEKDGNKCQCCGSTKDLDAHHKNGYSWCKEQRYDVNNGAALCYSCHCDFHEKYGREMNTEEQYNEWINTVNPDDIVHKERNIEYKETRKIYCYEESKIYDSVDDFKLEKGLSKHDSSISKACNHFLKDAHGFHLFWYDEYINLTESEIQSYVNN